MAFTHLHVHSDYSADGLSPVNDLVMRAKALGMEGIALTDHGTLAGVPEFVAKCQNEGLKPIIGCEFWITDHQGFDVKEKELRKPFHLILLAKDAAGYRNLVRLSSISNDEGLIRGKPHITHELLERYHEGLICSSACIGGEVPQAILKGDAGRAAEAARWYRDLFGDDFYLEVSLHKPHARTVLSRADDRAAWKARNKELTALQTRANEGIFTLGRELGIKVVATNDVHFSGRDEALAQDVVLCANAGKKVSDPDRLRYSHQEYVKNEAEMLHIFPDHPEAIANTMEVLSKVESFSIRGDVRIPQLCDDPAGRLRTLATAGARQRYGSLRPEVSERLDRELEEYVRTGAEPLLLLLKDLVDHTRQTKGIAVGPGRGASPSSLVCYCLGITGVDPLENGLLFERFVNPERAALPDIDIDFEHGGRDEVISYLKETFGDDCVAFARTYGAWSKRTAWLAAAKALGLPKATVKKVSQAMSEYNWCSLQFDIHYSPAIADIYRHGSPLVKEAFDTAIKLDRTHNGQDNIHACAVLISPEPLQGLVPTARSRGELVSQYDAYCAEDAGVLKVDLLGLGVLDTVNEAQRLIRMSTGELFDMDSIPLDDPDAMKVFSDGDTAGVFQFESEGFKPHLHQIRNLRFADLVALNALYRPGPMVFIWEYIDKANGDTPKRYVLDIEGEVLDETHGVLVYQEQLMRLSSLVAGFTPAQADLFRKAAGKKKRDVLDDLHGKFISGGRGKGHPEDALERLWGELTAKGTWLFQKSHALCYALLGYRTAWLKAHYPWEYFSALLGVSHGRGYLEETDWYRKDCEAHGFEVIPPDQSISGEYIVVRKP